MLKLIFQWETNCNIKYYCYDRMTPCEHGNEPSDSIRDGDYLDWLSDY
jgi:hypothetical protein